MQEVRYLVYANLKKFNFNHCCVEVWPNSIWAYRNCKKYIVTIFIYLKDFEAISVPTY